MTPSEIAWFVISVIALISGFGFAAFTYRDGFVDGARWMARGDRHLSRPNPRWHGWRQLHALRNSVKEGWYEAARSYSRGLPRGEIETTGMREKLE
jgi:hypothetical protein